MNEEKKTARERKEETECMELWLNKWSAEPAGPAGDT
jgi:hypothetical protein